MRTAALRFVATCTAALLLSQAPVLASLVVQAFDGVNSQDAPLPPVRLTKGLGNNVPNTSGGFDETEWAEVEVDGKWLPVCASSPVWDPDLIATGLCKKLNSTYVKGWIVKSNYRPPLATAAVYDCLYELQSALAAATSNASTSQGASSMLAGLDQEVEVCRFRSEICKHGPLLEEAARLQCSVDGVRPPAPPPPSPPPPAPLFFSGDARLIQQSDEPKNIGVLMVNYEGTFGTVCTARPDAFDDALADVACRSMGYTGGVKNINYFEYGGWPLQQVMSYIKCQGNETSLAQCEWAVDLSGCFDMDIVLPPVSLVCTVDFPPSPPPAPPAVPVRRNPPHKKKRPPPRVARPPPRKRPPPAQAATEAPAPATDAPVDQQAAEQQQQQQQLLGGKLRI